MLTQSEVNWLKQDFKQSIKILKKIILPTALG